MPRIRLRISRQSARTTYMTPTHRRSRGTSTMWRSRIAFCAQRTTRLRRLCWMRARVLSRSSGLPTDLLRRTSPRLHLYRLKFAVRRSGLRNPDPGWPDFSLPPRPICQSPSRLLRWIDISRRTMDALIRCCMYGLPAALHRASVLHLVEEDRFLCPPPRTNGRATPPRVVPMSGPLSRPDLR
jgi:hypothetical protein